jgi:uncharacterized protein (TIGR00251 family)
MLTESRDGVRLTLHVQPGARRNSVVGQHGDALKVAVSSPPVDGRANEAVRALMAEVFDVPVQSVSVVAGISSRRKVVAIHGVALSDAEHRISKFLPSSTDHRDPA